MPFVKALFVCLLTGSFVEAVRIAINGMAKAPTSSSLVIPASAPEILTRIFSFTGDVDRFDMSPHGALEEIEFGSKAVGQNLVNLNALDASDMVAAGKGPFSRMKAAADAAARAAREAAERAAEKVRQEAEIHKQRLEAAARVAAEKAAAAKAEAEESIRKKASEAAETKARLEKETLAKAKAIASKANDVLEDFLNRKKNGGVIDSATLEDAEKEASKVKAALAAAHEKMEGAARELKGSHKADELAHQKTLAQAEKMELALAEEKLLVEKDVAAHAEAEKEKKIAAEADKKAHEARKAAMKVRAEEDKKASSGGLTSALEHCKGRLPDRPAYASCVLSAVSGAIAKVDLKKLKVKDKATFCADILPLFGTLLESLSDRFNNAGPDSDAQKLMQDMLFVENALSSYQRFCQGE